MQEESKGSPLPVEELKENEKQTAPSGSPPCGSRDPVRAEPVWAQSIRVWLAMAMAMMTMMEMTSSSKGS